MTTFAETYEFVKTLNHPNIKLNIDTGNLIMENETLPSIFDISLIGHVQISFPFLSNWDSKYESCIKTEIKKFLEQNTLLMKQVLSYHTHNSLQIINKHPK
jgi:hypothetical protein